MIGVTAYELPTRHADEIITLSLTFKREFSIGQFSEADPHGHIITGDLKIIENAKLKELASKGPKYREPNKINWKATENMIFESIDLYTAERWAKQEQDNLKYLSK